MEFRFSKFRMAEISAMGEINHMRFIYYSKNHVINFSLGLPKFAQAKVRSASRCSQYSRYYYQDLKPSQETLQMTHTKPQDTSIKIRYDPEGIVARTKAGFEREEYETTDPRFFVASR